MQLKTPKRFFSFIVALGMIHNGEIFAQEIKKIPTVLNVETQLVTFKSFQKRLQHGLAVQPAAGNVRKIDLVQLNKLPQPLDGGYFSDHLTFFCRTELKLEKAIQVPVKFRLGSVAYTDYLERKPNALKP